MISLTDDDAAVSSTLTELLREMNEGSVFMKEQWDMVRLRDLHPFSINGWICLLLLTPVCTGSPRD